MNYKKIALVGMMGSGKSTISAALSKKLNYPCYEMDEIFVEQEKISIKDFFSKFNETQFREKETKILEQITKKDCFILSSGGGVVVVDKNRSLLFRDDILSIYLSIKPKSVLNRLKGDTTRPLLNVSNPLEEIEKIISTREKFYNMANLKIEVDNKTIKQIVEEILDYAN